MPNRLFRRHTVVFALVWAVAALYLGWRADRGWIPHDEGFLGQSAERVLLGELPHRDFDDLYTGGLSFLHAAVFELFGVRLVYLRWTLLLFSLVAIAAIYAIASRLASPLSAGAVTLVAVAWSLPIYFAGLPSWYNLFFALFGVWALLRHLETDGRRWILVAGLCGGLSCLFKIVGLYYVAAAMLFLLYREQSLSGEAAETSNRRRPRALPLMIAASLLTFGLVLAMLIARTPRPMEILHFLVPGLALGALLLWREHRLAPAAGRWVRLMGLFLPFVAGAAAPVALFLLPYLASGSVGELIYGVLILPQKRWQFAATPLPPLSSLVAALPMAALLIMPAGGSRGWNRGPLRTVAVTVVAVAAGSVVAFGSHPAVFRGVWHSVRPLIPLTTLAGCRLLVRGDRDGSLPALRRQQLFLLLSASSLLSLVQYPESFEVYFAYTAPAVALALAAVVRCRKNAPLRLHAVLLGCYLAFATVWLHRTLPQALGSGFWKVTRGVPLALERGGLRMPRRMAATYQELVNQVWSHSAPGSYIYAAPDSPEVYFLSARRNPTRAFFDFFDNDYGGNSRLRAGRLLALMDEHRVAVVVLKQTPQFSRFPIALEHELPRRFPRRADVYPYSIYWRRLESESDTAHK